MSILNDRQIAELCTGVSEPMISPFKDRLVREVGDRPVLSSGLTSFGYDVSLSQDVKIFTNLYSGIIDVKKVDPPTIMVDATVTEDSNGDAYVILPPNSYLLGVTEEYFIMPEDVTAVCYGKSTWARAGLIVNVTPIECGFRGNVVIEAANATPVPIKVYLHEGISQFVFFRGEKPQTTYADRKGKYQGQTGVTHAKV